MIFFNYSRDNYKCYHCGWMTAGIIVNGKRYCIVCHTELWRCPNCGEQSSANNGKCRNCGRNLVSQKEKENERIFAKV